MESPSRGRGAGQSPRDSGEASREPELGEQSRTVEQALNHMRRNKRNEEARFRAPFLKDHSKASL